MSSSKSHNASGETNTHWVLPIRRWPVHIEESILRETGALMYILFNFLILPASWHQDHHHRRCLVLTRPSDTGLSTAKRRRRSSRLALDVPLFYLLSFFDASALLAPDSEG